MIVVPAARLAIVSVVPGALTIADLIVKFPFVLY